MKKVNILDKIKNRLGEVNEILAARVYGSWLYNEAVVDYDVAVMIPSRDFGIVDHQTYKILREVRAELAKYIGGDVDIIPHTEDEITDIRSPLWYPRYNPSLVFGETIKGEFEIDAVTRRDQTFSFADLAIYVLYDNRTVCRRQLMRDIAGEGGRIFVSKLIHGSGNALTYHACCVRNVNYLCSPSDTTSCFHIFDKIYGADSGPAVDFLRNCKNRRLNFKRACQIMTWYECLVATVLGKIEVSLYDKICADLGHS